MGQNAPSGDAIVQMEEIMRFQNRLDQPFAGPLRAARPAFDNGPVLPPALDLPNDLRPVDASSSTRLLSAGSLTSAGFAAFFSAALPAESVDLNLIMPRCTRKRRQRKCCRQTFHRQALHSSLRKSADAVSPRPGGEPDQDEGCNANAPAYDAQDVAVGIHMFA